MREVPEAGKPTSHFWIWLIATIVTVGAINVAFSVYRPGGRPTFIALNCLALLTVIVYTKIICPSGFRKLVENFWFRNIRGYDRVWFLNRDGSINDRIEPRWHRNALLNCREGTPTLHAIYEQVTGWGWRTYRIGQYDGTPHISWRTDIKLNPVYTAPQVLASLIASDGSCPGIQFTLEGLLFFLNKETVNSLFAGLSNLIDRMTTLEKAIAVKIEFIAKRDVEIGELRRQYWSEKLGLQARVANLDIVASTAYMALEDLLDRMKATSRLASSKEGRTMMDKIAGHRNGILYMQDQVLKLGQSNGTGRIAPMSGDDVANFRYFPQ